jgi:hypothetical protein
MVTQHKDISGLGNRFALGLQRPDLNDSGLVIQENLVLLIESESSDLERDVLKDQLLHHDPEFA